MKLIERVQQERAYQEELYSELRENPINLDDIFDLFVNTIHFNYIGYDWKKQYYTPSEYHTYVFSRYRYHTLTVEQLVRCLHQLTGDMHDRHLRFTCDDWIDYRNHAMKYRVRAYEDVLYVTRAEPETGLVPGDQILEIQHMSPERVRKYTRHNCFYSREPERELWGGYLRMATHLLVKHPDGTVEDMHVPVFPAENVSYPITFEELGNGVVCLKFCSLYRADVSQLIHDHEAQIRNAKKLIIDLRQCIGGEDGAGWELFPYAVDKETKISDLLNEEGSYVLCTRENCGIRIQVLQQAIAALRGAEDAADAQELQLASEELKFYQEHYGQGMVFVPAPEVEEEIISPAQEAPEKIVVLTDTFCENEGETLVSMLRRCGSKVTVIGRPTMGTLDFYDCIHLQINEHMRLSYPIRMTKAAFEGRGIAEKGIPVDRYIPWTPEEIGKDLILEEALR